MRLKTLIVLSIIVLLCITAGITIHTAAVSADPMQSRFKEAERDFEAVSLWAMGLHEEYADENGNLCVTLRNDRVYLVDTEVNVPEGILSSLKSCKSSFDYSFISVKKDHAVFWRDETGAYGIIWAKPPRSVIKAMRKNISPRP